MGDDPVVLNPSRTMPKFVLMLGVGAAFIAALSCGLALAAPLREPHWRRVDTLTQSIFGIRWSHPVVRETWIGGKPVLGLEPRVREPSFAS